MLSDKSLPVLKFMKTFHRSTMTDERPLTTPAMKTIERETAKTIDMTELIKTFCVFEN